MKKQILLAVCAFLILSYTSFSQDKENKWVVGAGVGVVKFESGDGPFIGDQYIVQIPRLNVSRYMFNGITFDAALGFNTIDGIGFTNGSTYFTFDGHARYAFGTETDNAVPYILVGGSFIKAKQLTPTINIGLGNTLWFSQRYGINVQAMYKYSRPDFGSQRSHLYFSVGLVYSLQMRTLVSRLWQGRG